MVSIDKKQVISFCKRHYRSVVAFVAGFLVVFSLSLVGDWFQGEKTNPVSIDRELVTPPVSLVQEGLSHSVPNTLRIPAIDLETSFVTPLGLDEEGRAEVPDSYEKVGWYKYGPTPGEMGPAVILGHVDSYEGPAVFYSLGKLNPGDEIYIDRADGSTVTFVVDRVEKHSQESFPTAAVYGDLDYPGLRLITCTGIYSHETLRYSHNLIVYAKMNRG